MRARVRACVDAYGTCVDARVGAWMRAVLARRNPGPTLDRRVSAQLAMLARLVARVSLPHAVLHRASPLAMAHRTLSSAGDVVEVNVPSMGHFISEGTILSLLKQPDDYVDA
eukprot:CAMPEP_0183331866 /NCGR_PEP_ID=MMETSP0164_2-20130417/1185_1 /TAXON_ID=221442 /ORGANISM="Coccolithus pelagicus ssp braarudi, Strain PLY182g" /LENGTH=111 /DNA_ID=CAMNT_0025500467 /DNA_START=67 /DNA_END=402 /DNA_ORIENTATION=-